MATRRRLLIATAFGVLAPAVTRAQARRVKIGMLGPSPFNVSVYASGVKRGFEDLGYKEARASIEYRSSDGSVELYATQAKELVDMKCDLYVPLFAEAPVRAIQLLH